MIRTLDLAVHALDRLRAREKILLRETCADADDFLALDMTRLSRLVGRSFRGAAMDFRAAWDEAERLAAYLELRGADFLTFSDADYPSLLKEIYDPPFGLFLRGSSFRATDDDLRIAVVGTRNPTRRAAEAAYRLGFELGRRGAVVVSGLARGIDEAAHRGCLDGGGRTEAVLGSGIDEVYPVRNRTLAQRILAEGGLVLSEYDPGTPPEKRRFPERNRIISGLCRCVVVVQAPEGSGALITADFGLEQGREVCVHATGATAGAASGAAAGSDPDPGFLVDDGNDAFLEGGPESGNERLAGSAKLALDGAPVIDSADELFALLRLGTLQDRLVATKVRSPELSTSRSSIIAPQNAETPKTAFDRTSARLSGMMEEELGIRLKTPVKNTRDSGSLLLSSRSSQYVG